MLSEKAKSLNAPNSSHHTPRSEGLTSQVSTLSGTPSRNENNLNKENPQSLSYVKQHPVQYWNPNGNVYYTTSNGNNNPNSQLMNNNLHNLEPPRRPIGVRTHCNQIVSAELTPSASYYSSGYVPGRYDSMNFTDSTNQFCTDFSSVLSQGVNHISHLSRDWVNHQKDSLLRNINSNEVIRNYYAIPDKASDYLSKLEHGSTNKPQVSYDHHNQFAPGEYNRNVNYGYSYAYQPPYLNRNMNSNECLSLCLPASSNSYYNGGYDSRIKRNELGICQSFLIATGCASAPPPECRVRSKTPGELVLSPILSGLNKVIDVASDITLNLFPRIPDKDSRYPGTGCTMVDIVNDTLDQSLTDSRNQYNRISSSKRGNVTQKTDIPVFDWINDSLDKVYEDYRVKSKPKPKYKNNDMRISDVVFGSCYRSTDYVDPYELANKSIYDSYRNQQFIASQTPCSYHMSPRTIRDRR